MLKRSASLNDIPQERRAVEESPPRKKQRRAPPKLSVPAQTLQVLLSRAEDAKLRAALSKAPTTLSEDDAETLLTLWTGHRPQVEDRSAREREARAVEGGW